MNARPWGDRRNVKSAPARWSPAPPQGVFQREDGLYVVRYQGRQVGLWTKKRWAKADLRSHIRNERRNRRQVRRMK